MNNYTTIKRNFKHLTSEKRAQIEILTETGISKADVARTIGIARSTLYESMHTHIPLLNVAQMSVRMVLSDVSSQKASLLTVSLMKLFSLCKTGLIACQEKSLIIVVLTTSSLCLLIFCKVSDLILQFRNNFYETDVKI